MVFCFFIYLYFYVYFTYQLLQLKSERSLRWANKKIWTFWIKAWINIFNFWTKIKLYFLFVVLFVSDLIVKMSYMIYSVGQKDCFVFVIWWHWECLVLTHFVQKHYFRLWKLSYHQSQLKVLTTCTVTQDTIKVNGTIMLPSHVFGIFQN